MSGRAAPAGAAQIEGEDGTKPDADLQQMPWRFDPWLDCSHRYVTAIGDNITASLVHLVDAGRKRKIKKVDRDNREAILRAVLANLAYCVVQRLDPPGFAVSFKAMKEKRDRYERPGFTGLPRIIQLLGQAGLKYLTLRTSNRHGIASAVVATRRFAEEVGRFKFRPQDFTRLSGQELVWLTRAEIGLDGRQVGRELIDYRETPETERLRAEVEEINNALAAADIAFVPDDGPAVPTRLRALRRIFNLPPDAPQGTERFDLGGGRLYGEAFWLTLPKPRRAGLRVQGEPVAVVDAASMFFRLAYAAAGHTPPPGDLYASVPGLSEPRWREGIKRAVHALWYREKPLLRLPKGTRKLLPAGLSHTDLLFALRLAHPAIAHLFETNVGYHLTLTESRIMMRTLQALAARDVVFLPLFDGGLCACSKGELAATAMADATGEITGHRLPILLKKLY